VHELLEGGLGGTEVVKLRVDGDLPCFNIILGLVAIVMS